MATASKTRVPFLVVCIALFVLAQLFIMSRMDTSRVLEDGEAVEAVANLRGNADKNAPNSAVEEEPPVEVVDAPVDTTTAKPLPEKKETVKPKPVSKPKKTKEEQTTKEPIAPEPGNGGDDAQTMRMQAIKNAMKHAWSGYEERAFGADEVGPISGQRKQDVWGDLGVTLVDALDTLFIMDMKEEFQRAREWISSGLDFQHLGKDGDNISVFEITIRELGGLLSAYDLSHDEVFKARAIELGDLLIPAFENGVFYTQFNVHTKAKSMNSWTNYRGLLADLGTLQLELRHLSDISGNPIYAKKGDAFYDIIKREGSYRDSGLFPVHYDPNTGHFAEYSTIITIGALGDSFYEYLLKVWLYSGQRKEDKFLRDLYNAAVDGLESKLLTYSEPDNAYYLQELMLPHMTGYPQQDHLLCFVPGMLALGTMSDTDPARVVKHLDMAKKLMKTCYSYYSRQPTGLAPDIIHFPGFVVKDSRYKLRPETVESLMYLYRVTKDPIYREWGWKIFESIEKHAKTKYGYGAVLNVDSLESKIVEDKMESFFMAETLKYHYLLQSSPSLMPLDKYVFNTEAHPFSIVH